MANLNQTPPLLLARATSLWYAGRIHFPKDRIGEIIHEDEPFEIFHQMIAAQPGFRSKIWLVGRETGITQGLYEWITVEDAENYWMSFPMRLLKKRSVPASLLYNIYEI